MDKKRSCATCGSDKCFLGVPRMSYCPTLPTLWFCSEVCEDRWIRIGQSAWYNKGVECTGTIATYETKHVECMSCRMVTQYYVCRGRPDYCHRCGELVSCIQCGRELQERWVTPHQKDVYLCSQICAEKY